MKRAGGIVLLFLLLVAVVIATTWPWARTFSSDLLVHWDPPFHAWKLNLVADSILQGQVFPPDRTTNAFFPSSLTLYFEALHWPQALAAAGLRLFTDNVVLVYHLVLVAFWAFSGVCFFWLLRETGASIAGSVLGAAVFVAMPFRVSYMLEFNMQLCAGLVLFLLFLFRFLRAPGFANALGLSFSVWFQAASELYLALIMVIVSPWLVAPSLRTVPWRGLTRRSWSGVGAALLAGAGASWYFVWPYLVLKRSDDFSRGLREMGRHFVEPLSYLSGFATRAFLPWIHKIRVDELSVYPGTLVLLGALLYAASSRKILRPTPGRPGDEPRFLSGVRVVRFAAIALLAASAVWLDTFASPGAGAAWTAWPFNALLVAVPSTSLLIALAAAPGADPAARARAGLAGAASLAFLLSLGPKIVTSNSGWYAANDAFVWLHRHLSLLGGMRVVSRFSIVVLVFLLVAAVAGWETLRRRWPRALWTAPLIVLLVCAESRPTLVRTRPFEAPWRSPALTAMEREPEAPLLVLPLGDRDWDGAYMLGIAGSRRRLLYGWGGFYPAYQTQLAASFNRGDVAGGVRLAEQVWPSPYLLLDRLHVRKIGRYHDQMVPWGQLEGELAAASEPVAADERFTLFKARNPATPRRVYQRITRRDVLAANPTVVFSARSAAGDLPAAIAVNGSVLGRFSLSEKPAVYALAVPPEALETVYPNAIQIGGCGGGEVAVESFTLASETGVPAAARVIAVDPAAHEQGPWPAWLGSVGTLPATARAAAVEFSGGIDLSGYEVATEVVRPGQSLDLSYFLSFDQDVSFGGTPTLVTRLQAGDRLLAEDGFEATAAVDRASVRAQPYRKFFPVGRRLDVPVDAPPGRYELRIALTENGSGRRIRGTSALAEHRRWFTLPGSIEVLPGGRT